MYIDDLTGGSHDIMLPHKIDMIDNRIIGVMMFFLSESLSQGEIKLGPHIVVIEKRIE